ncbi:MAG: VWA domain-containing protein [Mariniblastus sp.]
MNLGFEITFDRPWFLLLLLILPMLWYLSFNSLAGLGKTRRVFALLLRSLVVLLMVMALAEAKWQRSTDRLTVIYLLDQSESIPIEKREFMLTYAYEEVVAHRREKEKDKAGVIVFGGNAKIESAPFDGQLPLIGKIESTVDLETSATSLESALKLAKASFPEDTARRVVIISDGNENNGDAMAIAQSMAEDGIGIDVIPVELISQSEISVDKVVLPTDIRKGQKFESKVVLTNNTGTGEPVKGKLRLTRKTATSSVVVAEQEVTLDPGKNIIGFDSQLDRSAVYTTEAVFVPNDLTQDLITQNNRASAFTHVRGKGKVLLIEDKFHEGEFDNLIQRLQDNAIEVEIMNSSNLFTTSAELLQYDSVILANLPRAAGDDAGGDIEAFSDAQIKMMVDNCEHMGCGIVMLGGDRAFGAGGWSNSLLEKAMPVDFQIKNDKVSAVGALALMMHASEMANGNYWQTKIGIEAINVLGPMDYCGVIDWSDYGGNPRWLWKLPNGVDRVYRNRNRMLGLVNKMAPGDMPDFNKPMRVMLNGLKKVNASMKHVIIISDGDPTPPTNRLLNDFVKAKIKISTAAVGTHGAAGSTPLQKIAKVTGGQYYVVKNAKALPKIYQREARRVAKPVIKESEGGMSLVPTSQSGTHEIMRGIDAASLPPFYGYVMTTIKKSNLVQQLAIASEPENDGGENSTVLAAWRYGNGRTIAFTSDAGRKWTSPWFNDEQYDKLFSQMVRHSMRPITESANFTVAAKAKDGMAQIVVTALDDNDNLLNFLEMAGHGINSAKTGDDDDGIPLQFNQVAPGRYVAEHPIKGSGNLLYTIFPGEGYERLTAGINIPYSSEYSDRESNVALLESLTSFKPRGGQSGEIIDGALSNAGLEKLLETNTFRPTLTAAIGIRDIWPLLLVLCGIAFFADVFIRRVAVTFDWLLDYLHRFKSMFVGKQEEREKASITRLKSRKAEIEREIESRRASTKFEPASDPEISNENVSGKQRLENVLASEIEKTPALPPKIVRDSLADQEETSYTSRLLDAKRRVQKQRDRNKNPDDQ